MKSFSLIANLKWIWGKSTDDYPSEAARLIGYLYKQMNEIIEEGRVQGKFDVQKNQAFYSVQDIVIYILYLDNDHSLSKAEYRVYDKFCDACNFKTLPPDKVLDYREKLTSDELATDITYVRSMRKVVDDPDDYSAFINGLWCLALAEGDLNESEYDFIKMFYDEDVDDIPSSWAETKRLLKED
jgi:hypothetical protein